MPETVTVTSEKMVLTYYYYYVNKPVADLFSNGIPEPKSGYKETADA
jgi:hypothetical protein